jgi:thymidylate kinase
MNFIFAFDGPDASGKTMIAALVAEDLRIKFRDAEFSILADKMPGATLVGGEIRKILKNPELKIGRITERLLFAADAAEYFKKIWDDDQDGGPKEGHTIRIVDRWSPITEFMYAISRGVTPEELAAVRSTYTHMCLIKPDILFVVDVCLKDMNARLHADRRPACRIEHLGDEYHKKVWEMYRAAACDPDSPAREHCDTLAHRIERLDNTRPDQKTVRDIANTALAVIEAHIAERIKSK